MARPIVTRLRARNPHPVRNPTEGLQQTRPNPGRGFGYKAQVRESDAVPESDYRYPRGRATPKAST